MHCPEIKKEKRHPGSFLPRFWWNNRRGLSPGKTGGIKKTTLSGKSVSYQEIEGKAVLEGDLILSPEQLNAGKSRTEGTGRTNFSTRWPNKP